MSKKHFIRLADIIKYSGVFGTAQIEELAAFCQGTNPRFKRDRWIAYIKGECGPNGGKVK